MITDELNKAKQIFESYGKEMLKDTEISRFIDEYMHTIKNTWDAMRNLNITGACSSCAIKTPGGCCFKGVEEWYSHTQLLINIFLGADIPDKPMYQDSCTFVGETGCRLLSRNSFCINFLCDKIKNLVTEKDIKKLNCAAGKEIDCGVRFENAVTTWLTENI